MNSQSGLSFLMFLHKRLFQEKPQMDVLIIFLLAIVSLLVSVGFILRSAINESFSRSGSEEVMIISTKGASNEGDSFINEVNEAEFMALVAKNGLLEKTQLDKNMVISTSIKNDNGDVNYLSLRGVSQNSQLMKRLTIIEGGFFRPGLNEIIIGKSLADTSKNYGVGKTIELATKQWLVTGIFTLNGDIRENEIIGDITQIQTRYEANNMVNSIHVNGNNALLKNLQTELEDSEIDLDASIEKAFFAKQSKKVSQSLLHLQTIIALLIIPAAIAGMLSIQRIQVINLSQQLRTLHLLGYKINHIWLSMFLRLMINGVIAFAIAVTIIHIFVKDRVVEIDLGLQLTFIKFDISILTFALILAVVSGIIVISSYFSHVKKVVL